LRKRSVDAYRILEQLRQGMNASEIAKEQGVTRQAVNIWRKKFIEQGFLEKPRRGRPERVIEGTSSPRLKDFINRKLEKLDVKLLQRISEMEAKTEEIKAENEELKGRLRLLERERELEQELHKYKREIEVKEKPGQSSLNSEYEGSPT